MYKNVIFFYIIFNYFDAFRADSLFMWISLLHAGHKWPSLEIIDFMPMTLSLSLLLYIELFHCHFRHMSWPLFRWVTCVGFKDDVFHARHFYDSMHFLAFSRLI